MTDSGGHACFRLSRFATLLSATLLLMVGATGVSFSQDLKSYVLSTATTGGAFHQGGVSLSALVKLKLLPEQRIDLATRNSSGSMENFNRIRERTTDFAIAQALLGRHARTGTGIAAGRGAQKELRAVMMLWPNVEHFIVRKDLAPSGTIADFLALGGKRISLGRERSAIESNRVLLGNLGLDIDQDIDQAFLAFRGSVAAFRRGEIDGLSLPASTPVPAFTELMGQLGPDAVILNWSDEQRQEADGGLGLWNSIAIPAQTYPGQTSALQTVAQPNFLAVHADVDEEVVYAITRTVFENLNFLRRLHEPYGFLTPDNAVGGLPVPLHPGAIRYYEEIGLELEPTVIAKTDYDLFGDDLTTPETIRRRINTGTVSLITAEDGTSDRMIDDLVDVMADDGQLRVLPIKGRGTAHNLADLLYLNGIDLGVLQADALAHERQRNLFPDLVDKLRYIVKWADADVHLLVRGDILSIKDLRDKPVNFGPPGSGSEITAASLFNRHRIPVVQTSFGHTEALARLKAGEIAGMLHVAPRPVPLFHDVEVRDGLRFLSLPTPDEDDPYEPAAFTVDDYPALVFGEQAVETWSVPSILATYNWPAGNDRYGPIANFVRRFLDRVDALQAPPRHASWQSLDPGFDFEGWRRHPVVDEYLRQRRTADTSPGQGGPLTDPSDDQTPARPRPDTESGSTGTTSPRGPVF